METKKVTEVKKPKAGLIAVRVVCPHTMYETERVPNVTKGAKQVELQLRDNKFATSPDLVAVWDCECGETHEQYLETRIL